MNDRGRKLRRIDIVKSSNLDPQFVEQGGTREKLAARWEELEAEIGEDLFEQVFFHIRLMLVKDKPQGDILKEFENRVFKRDIKKRGRDFLEYCFDVIEAYRRIFCDRSVFGDGSDANKAISLINAMNLHFPASEWRACILSYFLKNGNNRFFEFIYRVEKIYLYHWVSGIRKDERFSDYTNVLNIVELNENIEGVIRVLDQLAEKNNFDEKIKTACERPDFYNAGFAKYILLRLELVNSEFDNPKYYSVKSVEHVLPQNPAGNSDWWDWFEEEEKDRLVHSIGNLVLLSKGKNSVASNKQFIEKKQTYLKDRVSEFPRSIQVLDYENWTGEVIRERAGEAIESVLAPL